MASSNCWVIETKKIRDVTRAPSKGPKPGGIRHELGSGDRRRQNSFLCYVYGGEGMQRVLLFEEYCVFKIFKISRFLPTADDTHTSTSQHEASRETQEQGSNLWACHCRISLALLRRPQQWLLQWLRACTTRRSTGTLQQYI